MVEDIMSERFEVHDTTRDIRESRELILYQCQCVLIEFHDSVFERLDITLHCRDGCAYLMREIREEVGTDFFLDRERLMEIIYRGDKRCEFIFPSIAYGTVSFTVDDILYRGHDRAKWSEYRAYPYKISQQYDKEPDNIHEEYTSQDIRHKSSFYSIFSYCPEIHRGKEGFLRGRNRERYHRVPTVPSLRHIECRIFRYILEGVGEIRYLG